MWLGEFRESTFRRTGEDQLASRLAERYGIRVAGFTSVETGVYRVRREDGPDWVARLFPRYRLLQSVEDEAEMLRALAEEGFLTERPAVADAVFIHEGQAVLLTDFVDGTRPRGSVPLFYHLGTQLGRLAALEPRSPAMARPGGAWHHLGVDGGQADEVRAARRLLAAFGEEVAPRHRPLYMALADELDRLEDLAGLPEGFVHPDFVPRNVLETAEGVRMMIDWAGSGRGSRLAPLGFLLWAAGVRSMERVEAAAAGYRTAVEPEPEEIRRLFPAIWYRPLVFAVWGVVMGGQGLTETLRELTQSRDLAQAIAGRAEAVLTDRLP